MKKLILLFALLLASHWIYAQKVNAMFDDAASVNMIIENQTGSRLFSIHVCKSLNDNNEPDADDWQSFVWSDDLIPSRFFEDDQAEQISIAVDDKTPCQWDIMVKESENDPTPIIFNDIDFCFLKKIVFFVKNGQIAYKIE